MSEVAQRKPRTEVTPETLFQDPERIYKRIDRLMGELEVERTTLVEAIARPYIDRCYKQDPNYEVNRLRRGNERLQKILAQSLLSNVKENSIPNTEAVNGTQQLVGTTSPF